MRLKCDGYSEISQYSWWRLLGDIKLLRGGHGSRQQRKNLRSGAESRNSTVRASSREVAGVNFYESLRSLGIGGFFVYVLVALQF